MELINATRMVAGYAMSMESSGRELLTVVVKGTFRLPKSGEDVRLHEEQLPLIMADTFTGEPGFSAPRYEVDFAPRKHRCDILLLGSAHAPDGRPTKRVPVGLRVGNWEKTFAVVGNRRWDVGVTGISATSAESFVTQPFSYDVAFGGVDAHHENPAKHCAFMGNPVGCGFHKHLRGEWVDGAAVPNTEELSRPVDAPDGDFKPMAFGPIGRGWEPRSRYGGTYDQQWQDDHFPFLPPDFDERYHQAAPPDQQMQIPKASMEVTLAHLTADGLRRFVVPHFEAPVHVFTAKGQSEAYAAVLDTIAFEPDDERFTMTWRVTRPLLNNPFEVAQILVGKKSRAWWRARERGKRYHSSLAQMVEWQRTIDGTAG